MSLPQVNARSVRFTVQSPTSSAIQMDKSTASLTSNHLITCYQGLDNQPSITEELGRIERDMASAHQPFIRPVNYSADRPALDHIFRVTCGESLKIEPAWTISSYLWCHPYPQLSPETCFVLDSGAGEAVGYILGTADTEAFAKRWKSDFLPSLDQKVLPRPLNSAVESKQAPEGDSDLPTHLLNLVYNDYPTMLNLSRPQMMERWPAHLHIDILPSHQRQGWGRKLIDTFLAALAERHCQGVHLGMEAGNAGSLKFYETLGFSRYPFVLDHGASGEKGRTGEESAGVIYLVKELEV